mmetsp:Transcript_62417/g.172965  ORF Transcript_62417/g.172965 Transcript_62417/m.172965 type:complete len:208 (+) Transcript_62417:1121-1744(+)
MGCDGASVVVVASSRTPSQSATLQNSSCHSGSVSSRQESWIKTLNILQMPIPVDSLAQWMPRYSKQTTCSSRLGRSQHNFVRRRSTFLIKGSLWASTCTLLSIFGSGSGTRKSFPLPCSSCSSTGFLVLSSIGAFILHSIGESRQRVPGAPRWADNSPPRPSACCSLERRSRALLQGHPTQTSHARENHAREDVGPHRCIDWYIPST